MSFQAMTWAHEQPYKDAQSKLLMLVLANYAGHENTCWPSVSTLATECLISERCVQYKIRELCESGLLKISPRKDEAGDPTSNLYRLMIPRGAPVAPPQCKPCTTPGAPYAPKPVHNEPVNEPLRGNGSKDVWFITKKIAAMESMATELKNKFSSEVAFGTQWDSPRKKDEYLKIKREIRELNRQISQM